MMDREWKPFPESKPDRYTDDLIVTVDFGGAVYVIRAEWDRAWYDCHSGEDITESVTAFAELIFPEPYRD